MRQGRTEQVKVNFTFQTILIFVLLEYAVVSISVLILFSLLISECHFAIFLTTDLAVYMVAIQELTET